MYGFRVYVSRTDRNRPVEKLKIATRVALTPTSGTKGCCSLTFLSNVIDSIYICDREIEGSMDDGTNSKRIPILTTISTTNDKFAIKPE